MAAIQQTAQQNMDALQALKTHKQFAGKREMYFYEIRY